MPDAVRKHSTALVRKMSARTDRVHFVLCRRAWRHPHCLHSRSQVGDVRVSTANQRCALDTYAYQQNARCVLSAHTPSVLETSVRTDKAHLFLCWYARCGPQVGAHWRCVHRRNAQCSPSAHTVSTPPTGTPPNWRRICRSPHVSTTGMARAPCTRW